MSARVAANLAQQDEVNVERIKGGLGEFSVSVDDSKVYASNRFWYPNPVNILKKLRAALKR